MNAVVFDLDGTLWDSSEQVAGSWNVILDKHPETRGKVISVAEMRGLMGKQMDEIARLMMPEIEENVRKKIMLECMDFELEYLSAHKPVLYPRLSETLEELSEKYALMIVSNCQDGYIQLFLRQLGSGIFRDFESFGKTGLSKGENITLVLKRNNVPCAVYVGDTQGDLDAADSAGVPFIHASYGFGATSRETDRIAEFSELTEVCGKML